MKTVRFGFGSATEATHLHIKSSVVKSAVAIVGPTALCLVVTACAFLQPYSMEAQSKRAVQTGSSDNTYFSSDTCTFGDFGCIARQSEFRSEQAEFLSRQYPQILKSAQALAVQRAALRKSACPGVQVRVGETAGVVRVMTAVYNVNAAQIDPAVLQSSHLPMRLAP